MLQYTYPGIYTQELTSGVHSITGAPTSVACFVGPTATGIDARPIQLLSFADFERNFGGVSANSNLSYSVLHFFNNGGGQAYVIRVPADGAKKASLGLKQDNVANADESVALEALSSGAAGNQILVQIDPFGIGANPYVDGTADKTRFNLSLFDLASGRTEQFTNLSTFADNARFASTIVNDDATGSKLVGLTIPGGNNGGLGKEGPKPTGSIYSIGNLPTGGNFSDDVNLKLSISAPDDTGAAKDVLKNLMVTVFAKDSAQPKTLKEVVTKLIAAINQAISTAIADVNIDPDVKSSMQATTIDAQLFESGRLLRLQALVPGPTQPPKRMAEATVTMAAPGGTTLNFLAQAQYNVKTAVEGPSSYRLGGVIQSSQQFGTPVVGQDGSGAGQPAPDDFEQAIQALEKPDPFFNILCLPDLVRPKPDDPRSSFYSNMMAMYADAARICELKHAFLLIDPPPDVVNVQGSSPDEIAENAEEAAEAWKTDGFTFQSSHSAAYFPNVRVDDPLMPGIIRSHPPSGALAGLYARTDSNVGVWEAPAGTDAVLSGVYTPSVLLSDKQQGILNPVGLNVIRKFPVYQTVSFGSRTVDGSNAMASQWKYIPVRRTASYILRSLSEGLRWAVHKPNGEQLWADLRMNVTAFMQGLFRQGAFKGSSARDAYFVQCDSSTTTADDIDHGVVNIIIGFAPLKPAEFVVISLKQIVAPAV